MAFDPRDYLISLDSKAGAKPYLPVAGRIMMMHDLYKDNPDLHIEIKVIHVGADSAVMHARVELPNGCITENVGSETRADFTDYIEKAATKALGRALALAGLGTEHALQDFEIDGAGSGKVVDSPPNRPAPPGAPSSPAPAPIANQQAAARPVAGPGPATDNQVRAIWSISRALGLETHQVTRWTQREHGADDPTRLSRADASRMIDFMKQCQANADKSPFLTKEEIDAEAAAFAPF